MTIKHYYAVSTEKGRTSGSIINNTKQGYCKGMSKEQFSEYLKKTTWESFEIKEMKTNYSGHRQFLNDKW